MNLGCVLQSVQGLKSIDTKQPSPEGVNFIALGDMALEKIIINEGYRMLKNISRTTQGSLPSGLTAGRR